MTRNKGLELLYERIRKISNDVVITEAPGANPDPGSLAGRGWDSKDQSSVAPKISPNEQALIDALEIKIAAGKWNLYNKAPELNRILSKMTIKIVASDNPHIKTMAVDNFGNIYINPQFADKLSDDEFYGVFAHEAMHIANGTFLRKGNRDFTLWNIATDAVMNWALAYDGFKLPKEGIVPDLSTGNFKFKDINKEIKVLDERGQPLAAEEVYDQLVNIQKKLEEEEKKKRKGQSGQSGFSGTSGSSGTSGFSGFSGDLRSGHSGKSGRSGGSGFSGQSGQSGQSGKGSGQSGKCSGTSGCSGGGGAGSGYTTAGASGSPYWADKDKTEGGGNARDYFKELDNQTDTHLTDQQAKEVNKDIEAELTPEKIKEIEQQRRGDISRGLETKPTAGRGASSKGAIRKLLQKSIPVFVDWKSVVKRYLRAANAKTTTWLKPSIRGLAGGYQAPGKSTSPNKLDAVFAIDTSGSVGTEELQEAVGFVRDISKTVSNINIRILLWHGVPYYLSAPMSNKGALENLLNNLVTVAGGTNMSAIDPYLQKKKIKPIVVIYITDGYVEANPTFGNYQKLFIIVNRQANNEDVKASIEGLFKKFGQVVITPTLTES